MRTQLSQTQSNHSTSDSQTNKRSMHPTTFLAALAITLPTLVSALPQGPPAGSPGAFSSPEDVKEPHCYEQAGEAPIPADFTDQCEKTKRDPWIDLTFKGSDGADWRFKFVTTQYDNKGAVLPKCSYVSFSHLPSIPLWRSQLSLSCHLPEGKRLTNVETGTSRAISRTYWASASLVASSSTRPSSFASVSLLSKRLAARTAQPRRGLSGRPATGSITPSRPRILTNKCKVASAERSQRSCVFAFEEALRADTWNIQDDKGKFDTLLQF